MKTAELIRELQALDPSGQEEVCVGNRAIQSVDRLPAYYDGRLQVLRRNDKGHTVGIEFRSRGVKINLCITDLEDEIYDNPEFEIGGDIPDWKLAEIAKIREEARTLQKNLAARREAARPEEER